MKKIFTVLLSLNLLLFFSCSTSKVIPYNEARTIKTDDNYLIIHTTNSKTFALHNYKFGENSIEGELKKFKAKNGYFMHVYSRSFNDLNVKKNTSIMVNLDKSEITKIRYKKTDIAMSVLKGLGIVTGIIFLGGMLDLAINGFDFSL